MRSALRLSLWTSSSIIFTLSLSLSDSAAIYLLKQRSSSISFAYFTAKSLRSIFMRSRSLRSSPTSIWLSISLRFYSSSSLLNLLVVSSSLYSSTTICSLWFSSASYSISILFLTFKSWIYFSLSILSDSWAIFKSSSCRLFS